MSETLADSGKGGDRRSLVRGLGWSGIGYPLNAGLLFLSQVLVARLVAPHEYGSYTVAVSVFTSAALIAQLGLPHTLLRRAAAALSRGDEAEARHEIISALFVATGAAIVCGLLLGSPLGEEFFDAAFPRLTLAAVAALIGIKSALRVIENIVPEILRSFRDYSRATIFGQLLTNLVFCLALGVVLATATDANVRDVLLISALASACALVPGLTAVATKLRGPKTSRPSIRKSVEPALWLSTVGLAFVGQLDLLVVGSLGTKHDAALYSAAFRLALLVGLPLVAVNQVVTPLIAGWHAQKMPRRIERTLRATAGIALLVAATVGAVYLFGGRFLLETLFGSFYGDAWGVLAILTVGQIVQTYAGSCGFSLLMTGNHRAYAAIVAVSMPMTLVLQVIGYKVSGIEGLAVATAIMLSLQNFAQMIVVRRRAGFSTSADPRATWSELIGAWHRRSGRGA
jgi:O-antigen/teichoic acid export membrane protein